MALRLLQQEFRYGQQLRVLLQEVAKSVMALARHPNVVQVYECGEQDSRRFFSMELLPGGSLDRRAGSHQMPPAEAAALARTLARTLDAVHRQGIVHGNLKPSKVLLAADGTTKIGGFIIARKERELSAPEPASATLVAPAVMGTPRYMAPEQLSGDTAAVGPATDPYALGLILYELLTGWLPFRAATLWQMMAQVLREPPEPPSRIRPDVPPALDAICLRCLAKEPRQRYVSAGDLAADLDRFLAGEPVASASPPPERPSHAVTAPAADNLPLRLPLPDSLGGPVHRPGAWGRLVGWLTGRPRKPGETA